MQVIFIIFLCTREYSDPTRQMAVSDLHEKNAFFAFPSRNAILITEISDFC